MAGYRIHIVHSFGNERERSCKREQGNFILCNRLFSIKQDLQTLFYGKSKLLFSENKFICRNRKTLLIV